MHLVKWFRKNMTKLMAIFVILIMIAFVMPSLLSQLARPHSSGPAKAMWYYDGDKKISFNDIARATNELGVLKSLFTDRFLLSQRDLRFVLLGQLLFPESATGSMMCDEIKRVAMQNQLRISSATIDNFFSQAKGRPELFWILLKAEAKKAGCGASAQQAGDVIKAIIANVTQNKGDAATFVGNVAQANQMTEDEALETFANVLAIASYADIVTNVEDVTEAQMAAGIAIPEEKLTAEFVEFKAETFIKQIAEPTDAEIATQFAKYKDSFEGTITDDNPYGFGYKQGPRVAVEYMALKVDEVEKLVDKPAEQESEDFYQQNLERFVEQVPADANDPNSQLVSRQKSYAEVANIIKDALFAGKVGAKATKILSETVEQAEADYDSLDFEKATIEQFRQKSKSYAEAAGKISKKYNINIYTGKTALLTAVEFQSNRTLGSLMIQGQSRIPTRLTKVVFAAEQLGDEAMKLGAFEPVKPKMLVSFGPLADNMGSIVAMARIVDAKKSEVPNDINFSYEKNLPQILETMPSQKEEPSFSLKEKVADDCKKLRAFALTCQKANEFIEQAKVQGWDKAVDALNEAYPPEDSNGPKTFELQNTNARNRVSRTDLELAKLNTANSPAADRFISQTIIYGKFIDLLYSQLQPGQTEAQNLPTVLEFKPQLSCYAVKSIIRDFATKESYNQERQRKAFEQDYIMSQSMMFQHYMPDNILKRLNLVPAQKSDDTADTNDANGVTQ